MYKSYILSITGCLLTIAVVAFFACFKDQGHPAEDYQYSCVFNQASMDGKLMGKSYDYVTEHYLPAKEIKGKKKKAGQFQAVYENIKVFSKGSRDVVRDMTLDYQDSVVVKIALGEAKPSKDARWLNLSPLSFQFMDWEVLTQQKNLKEKGKNKWWQLPILLVVFLMLVNFPLLVLWPVGVLIIKKWGNGIAIAGVLLLNVFALWLFDGIAAYADGSVGLFLFCQAITLIIMYRSMKKALPVHACASSSYSSRPTVSPKPYKSAPVSPTPAQKRLMTHISNLSWLMTAKNDKSEGARTQKRIEAIEAVNNRYPGLLTRGQFEKALSSPSLDYIVPNDEAIKKEYAKDFLRLLACDTSVPITFYQALMAMQFMREMGDESVPDLTTLDKTTTDFVMLISQISNRVQSIGFTEYGYHHNYTCVRDYIPEK